MKVRRQLVTVAAGLHYLRMDGKETCKNAVKAMEVAAVEAHVVLVGELRDLETMEAAVTAAETGHWYMGH